MNIASLREVWTRQVIQVSLGYRKNVSPKQNNNNNESVCSSMGSTSHCKLPQQITLKEKRKRKIS